MMVLRKLAVALLSAGVLLPGLGHALAVKELQTKSALGEPYQGEIEIVEVGDLSAGEVKVSLASQEDFERIGIQRDYFLTELKFDVVINPGDRSYIKVTSIRPVVEPYLNFVVRIAWPGNARMHEVTALLDPPVVSDTAAPEVNAAVSSAPEAPVTAPVEQPAPGAPAASAPVEAPATDAPPPVVTQPQPTPEPAPAPAPVAPAPAPAPAAADSYRTKSGDTMGRIAQQFRPAGATTAQAMVAIQRANPGAFANDNINQLKRGQVLRIPSESQMREVSAQEAQASLTEQTQAWRAAAPAPKPAALEGQQLDATAKAPAKAPEPVAEAKAEMKLLGGDAGKPGAAAAGSEQGAAVKPEDAGKLKDIKAKTESAKTDKKKLVGKVEGLEAKIKANDKQVEVQNARLAELDAQLKQQQAKQEAAKAAAPAPAAETAKPDAAPVPAPETAAAPAPAPAEQAAPAPQPAPAPAPQPAPVVAEEPAADDGMNLPVIAGGIGALLALLGGGWWWTQKRRRDQAAGEEFGEHEEATGEGGDMGDDLGFTADAGPVDDDWLSAPAETSADGGDQVLADPLEEAEQYIAYERWPQAVTLLKKAVAQNPDRGDLRMKLLECLVHTGDSAAFAEQEAWFESQGDLDSLARAEELKGGMTASAAADDDFSFDLDAPSAPAATAASGEELPSLEDMELDFNSTVNASSPALDTVKDADLDFGSFETELEPAVPAAASTDFDLDFEGSSFESAPAPVAASAAADEGLDFSLEEELSAAPASNGGDLGLGELEDFENLPDITPEPVKAAPAKSESDDLSFSLDDLEFASEPAPAAVAEEPATDLSLDAEFSLDENFDDGLGDAAAATPSFEETVRANAADTGLDALTADLDEATLAVPAPAAAPVPAAEAAADLGGDLGMDDEFDFLADTDENATKLDLARAYIDMGDMEGARDILQEVLTEGSNTQKDEAKGLLAQVG